MGIVSVTVKLVRVLLPEFLPSNVYVMVLPALAWPGPVLATVAAGAAVASFLGAVAVSVGRSPLR